MGKQIRAFLTSLGDDEMEFVTKHNQQVLARAAAYSTTVATFDSTQVWA